MARVLVTGGTGLFGSAVREYVEGKGKDLWAGTTWVFLSSKDVDLRNRQETMAVFEREKPTMVLHLAAYVGGLFRNMAEKVEFYRYNVLMNDNVMEACRVYGVKKCVSCLSTCIFPDKTSYPIDESMIHNGPPHPSNEGYAYAKRMVDVLNRAYTEEYPPSKGGCLFTSVIPTNIYGPRDNFNINDGHVIPGLVHKCYLAQQAGSDFTVWGSGTPLRQFIHSADLAELTCWVMQSYNDPSPIILAPDDAEEVSIADVARMVAAGSGFTGNLVFDTSKADGQFKKTASNAKLRGLRPDFKFRPMAPAVAEVCQWFKQHYNEARK